MTSYDIVTVGGGVGGSTLARAMAARGFRVLIVERQNGFTDRVRGEFLFPWGVAEAKTLDVYDALMGAGGHHPKYWTDYAGPDPLPPRDFTADTPQKLPGLCIYHPRMQEALLCAAEDAGAEVWRGGRVVAVEPGHEPRVVLEGGSGQTAITARLVVGADGRASMVRRWAGFQTHDEPPANLFAGVLVENVPASGESSICMINPGRSRMVVYFPQTDASGRAYLASRAEDGVRLHGSSGFASFLDECARSGLAPGLLDGARQAGPLATFDGADSWVDHPFRDGIALVGDAAGTSDPTWGQGLALTLRDVRALRDALLADDDWNAAGHAYAAAHDAYYRLVRTTNSWFTRIMLEPGPAAEELRARVLPQLESDPSMLPDTMVAGPDLAPPTEAHRRKLFGERTTGDPVAAS